MEAVAHQTETEVEEVERLLADSGKTIEDLQRDSERLMRHLGYKDALERLPALHWERAQLDMQIAAADRVLAIVDAELIRLSTDRHDLLDQASHLVKQALAEQNRAQRQLDPGYARQYRDKAAQLENDAAARRRDAQRVEKAHDELAKRRDRLEKQMRQA